MQCPSNVERDASCQFFQIHGLHLSLLKSVQYYFNITSILLQCQLQHYFNNCFNKNFNLASATVKWIRYRALYITWISLLIEWRHQSKIWCPFLCTAGFVYACVRLWCTGYTEGYTSQLRELWRCAKVAATIENKGFERDPGLLNGL